jgi:hypothetical protein
MFIVQDNPTFTHTVTAMVPVDGGHKKQTFRVTYSMVEGEEYEAFDLKTREGTFGFMRRVVTHLDDLFDEHGQSLPYSDTLREQVMRLPWARQAIVKGYFDALGKTAEGN